jgi:hypothetical protein
VVVPETQPEVEQGILQAPVLPTFAANVPAFPRVWNLSNEIADQSADALLMSIAIQYEQLKELDYETFMAYSCNIWNPNLCPQV